MHPAKTGNVNGGVKKHSSSLQWIVASTIQDHCNSLKPMPTEVIKWARLEMALHFVDLTDPTKYQDMRDRVHLDEKWFYLTWEKERYLLLPEEKEPT